MTKYLVNLGMFYQPKNKLHKAIQEFIQKQSRKVIPDNDLKYYKNRLWAVIDNLNSLHPKCTPVKVNFWSSDNDEHLQLENVVSLSMLKFEE
jgi:hypothetical protein